MVVITLLVACGGGSSDRRKPPAPGPEPVVDDPTVGQVVIPTTPTWAQDPAAGDRSVSAELGGPGFTGEGWTTASRVYAVGVPTAPQGGSLSLQIPDWPATLRYVGENGNTWVTYAAMTLTAESLLRHDPVTYEFVPSIASHWKESPDHLTYTFRIDPRARFNDGSEITADDVVASWRLNMSTGIRWPMSVVVFGKFEEPKALSKYVVEFRAKKADWQNLSVLGELVVLPAKELGTLTDTSPNFEASGAAFLERFQFAFPTTSGPYVVAPDDIKTGESVTFTRHRGWWHEPDPTWDGWYNLDQIKFVVVKDTGLAFEKVKKGELDYYTVPKAQWWAEEVPGIDEVKRGLLGATRFFTDIPQGTSGLALNMDRPPLDDDNVRFALQLLYDREMFNEKLFYGQYEPLTSYHQNGAYANPANVEFEFDEVRAVELLEKSGWTQKNAEGYRTKDGKELKFTVTYRSPLSERYLTLYQEACKRAGIRIELQVVSDSAGWKNIMERAYEIQEQPWGGLPIPQPDTSWHSSLADKRDNNNVTAFRDPRVDALIDQYNAEFDPQQRVRIIREMDGLIYNQHPYVLGWYGPSQRMLYWNKFGMPEWGSARVAWGFNIWSLFEVWWVDPAKEKALEEARKDPSLTMEKPPSDVRFWPQWTKQNGLQDIGDQAAPAKAP